MRFVAYDARTDAHTVMGIKHYTAGTIAVIACPAGSHPSKVDEAALEAGAPSAAVAMACKHGCELTASDAYYVQH
jgi:hypothetical protein|eukprot:COSAG06_NODE_259_length_18912_cov_53.912614_17_plen_75_part_00